MDDLAFNFAGDPSRWTNPEPAQIPSDPAEFRRMLTDAVERFDSRPPPPITVHSVDEAVIEIVRGFRVICHPRIYERLREMGDEGIQARYDEIRALLQRRLAGGDDEH